MLLLCSSKKVSYFASCDFAAIKGIKTSKRPVAVAA
jgi:hypothetical protein